MLRLLRRATFQRAGSVLAAAVLHLFLVSPSAARFVYCVGADGHSGIELLQSSENGCVDCCHEIAADPSALGSAANPGLDGCRDVLLSSPDALSGPERANPEGLTAPTGGLLGPLALPSMMRASSVRGLATRGPLRASATRLIRHTVLLI